MGSEPRPRLTPGPDFVRRGLGRSKHCLFLHVQAARLHQRSCTPGEIRNVHFNRNPGFLPVLPASTASVASLVCIEMYPRPAATTFEDKTPPPGTRSRYVRPVE